MRALDDCQRQTKMNLAGAGVVALLGIFLLSMSSQVSDGDRLTSTIVGSLFLAVGLIVFGFYARRSLFGGAGVDLSDPEDVRRHQALWRAALRGEVTGDASSDESSSDGLPITVSTL